uniref:N-acetyltransferase domain-containing protein n=1 Tax=Thermosporothrix sp. COM3 TaxID=2490863 RepID=A0A455SH63_9CHLR|nr:hypothetical protein KTC_14120 [Thermosporothrix sp. COM3]
MPVGYLTDVETRQEERGKGYGRCVREAAIRWMRALALLHGITDFYPKFGYIGVDSAVFSPVYLF